MISEADKPIIEPIPVENKTQASKVETKPTKRSILNKIKQQRKPKKKQQKQNIKKTTKGPNLDMIHRRVEDLTSYLPTIQNVVDRIGMIEQNMQKHKLFDTISPLSGKIESQYRVSLMKPIRQQTLLF